PPARPRMVHSATLRAFGTRVDLRRSPSRSTRYYNVITGKRLLPAAHACTYAKTPTAAFPLVTGSLGTSCKVPPAGFEPAHTAPEAVALSPELRGRVGRGDRGDG